MNYNIFGGGEILEELGPQKDKRAITGFIISLVGGIIILAVSLYMTAMMAWMASLISDFAYYGGLNGLDFGGFFGAVALVYGVIGLILGLLVIVGAVLIYKRKEVVGGILVIVFSVLSIIAGGGLIVGLVLGIIGGILGILKK